MLPVALMLLQLWSYCNHFYPLSYIVDKCLTFFRCAYKIGIGLILVINKLWLTYHHFFVDIVFDARLELFRYGKIFSVIFWEIILYTFYVWFLHQYIFTKCCNLTTTILHTSVITSLVFINRYVYHCPLLRMLVLFFMLKYHCFPHWLFTEISDMWAMALRFSSYKHGPREWYIVDWNSQNWVRV